MRSSTFLPAFLLCAAAFPAHAGITFFEATRTLGIEGGPSCPTCGTLEQLGFGEFKAQLPGPGKPQFARTAQHSWIDPSSSVAAQGLAELNLLSSDADWLVSSALHLHFMIEGPALVTVVGTLFAAAGDESAALSGVAIKTISGTTVAGVQASGVPGEFGFEPVPVDLPVLLPCGEYLLEIQAAALGFGWAFDAAGFATFDLKIVFSPVSPPCPADLDGSGDVDGADLGVLLGAWGPCPDCTADLNADAVVNGADIGLLLGLWGTCPEPG